jgi:hypothetical protein
MIAHLDVDRRKCLSDFLIFSNLSQKVCADMIVEGILNDIVNN